MAHIITWERQGIVRTFSEHVTSDEVFSSSHEFYRDTRSSTAKYQLIDCINVKSMEFSQDDAEIIASISAGAAESIKGIKVALVSNNQEVIAIFDQYVSLSLAIIPSWQFKIFHSLGKARHWLDTSLLHDLQE